MTREEANQKVATAYDSSHYPKIGEQFVKALEALGLIKFDEEKKQYDTRIIIFSNQSPCAYQAIAQLEGMGYTVTLNNERKV